jgi:hypothetical protein
MVRLGFNCSRQGSTNACSIPSRPQRLVSRRLRRVLPRHRRHHRRASLVRGRSRGTTRTGRMGAAVHAGGMSTLTDVLAAAAPPLHGLVVKGLMLLASRRQHRLRLCALHMLHLVLFPRPLVFSGASPVCLFTLRMARVSSRDEAWTCSTVVVNISK